MMTSLCLSTFPTITTSQSPLLSKPSSNIRFKVSCNASNSDNHLKTPDENPNIIHNNNNNNNVDRRNLLLGLGGLYGATNLTNIGSALAYPITAPDDISHCEKASTNIKHPEDAVRGLACCPPKSPAYPKPYVLPSFGKQLLRVRRPAHKLTPDYIKKYQNAIKKMKALPDEHPHSWKQQGKIHCAYCNGGYTQEMNGRDDLKIQVHGSSLFYPFHRWYLYFYERILGKLIGDPTFALPYWNWDNPMGMMLPAMFEAPGDSNDPKNNPLFDPYRDAGHRPPVIIDLQYSGVDSGAISVDQISDNLSTMYNQMVRARCTDAFFGTDPDPERESLYGYIESGAHTAVHIWTGNPRMANREDLGNFSSAGYDPVFYVHHANVDRMWDIWRSMSHRNKDPTSDDWLNASYVFYDENEELVRVYNKDCVNMRRMGYMYEKSSIPWLKSRPTPRRKAGKVGLKLDGVVKKANETEFPVKLDKIVKVLVKRPVTNRSEDDKKKAAEMLILDGIKFNSEHFFKFDVLVNDDEEDGVKTTAASSEFVGTFAQVPHMHGDNMYLTGKATFEIDEILEDIEAEDDEHVLVTLVPRAGTSDATVSKIKIELVPTC